MAYEKIEHIRHEARKIAGYKPGEDINSDPDTKKRDRYNRIIGKRVSEKKDSVERDSLYSQMTGEEKKEYNQYRGKRASGALNGHEDDDVINSAGRSWADDWGIGGYDDGLEANGYSPDQSGETSGREKQRNKLRDDSETDQEGSSQDNSENTGTPDETETKGDEASGQEGPDETKPQEEPKIGEDATKKKPSLGDYDDGFSEHNGHNLSKNAHDLEREAARNLIRDTEVKAVVVETAPEWGTVVLVIIGLILVVLLLIFALNAISKKYGADDCKEGEKTASGSGNVIVLDPGHISEVNVNDDGTPKGSSKNGGATGNGLKEFEVTYKLTIKIKTQLETKGYKVIMTRSSENEFISNKARSEIANNNDALLLMRIHNDGSTSTSTRGFWMLYPSHEGSINKAGVVKGPSADVVTKSKAATETILSSLKDALPGTGMPIYNGGIATEDSAGNADKNGGVLRGSIFSKVPVSLIEIGFLSNASDASWLKDDAKTDKFAEAMANGIEKAAPKGASSVATPASNKFYFPVGGTQKSFDGSTKSSNQPRAPSESNMIKKTVAQSFYQWPIPDSKGSTSDSGKPAFGACRGNSCERTHKGLDIYTNFGAPVIAPENGKITRIGGSAIKDTTEAAGGGKGRWIIMKGDSGNIYTFMHLEGFSKDVLTVAGLSDQIGNTADAGKSVSVAVTGGSTIAYVGNTGGIQNPHLHFQIGASGSEKDPKSTLTTWLSGGTGEPERSTETCGTVEPTDGTVGSTVISKARSQKGKPYVWGGCGSFKSKPDGCGVKTTEPVPSSIYLPQFGNQGYDCSGFVVWSWYWGSDKKFIPDGTTAAMWANRNSNKYTTIKNKGDIRAGDILLKENGGHVRLATGDGKMIDAPGKGKVVKEVSLNTSGYIILRPNY